MAIRNRFTEEEITEIEALEFHIVNSETEVEFENKIKEVINSMVEDDIIELFIEDESISDELLHNANISSARAEEMLKTAFENEHGTIVSVKRVRSSLYMIATNKESALKLADNNNKFMQDQVAKVAWRVVSR